MIDRQAAQRLRCAAYTAAQSRIRREFPADYARMFRRCGAASNPTLAASRRVAQLHPERWHVLYREEVMARGLPEPKPQHGRWGR